MNDDQDNRPIRGAGTSSREKGLSFMDEGFAFRRESKKNRQAAAGGGGEVVSDKQIDELCDSIEENNLQSRNNNGNDDNADQFSFWRYKGWIVYCTMLLLSFLCACKFGRNFIFFDFTDFER